MVDLQRTTRLTVFLREPVVDLFCENWHSIATQGTLLKTPRASGCANSPGQVECLQMELGHVHVGKIPLCDISEHPW